ncbi:hypothetical protein HZC07_01910 [Candidatus Micrarchaeota archaeon]|nr:hypothetical protein [Candidatus Micrarchaeota archaeon]
MEINLKITNAVLLLLFISLVFSINNSTDGSSFFSPIKISKGNGNLTKCANNYVQCLTTACEKSNGQPVVTENESAYSISCNFDNNASPLDMAFYERNSRTGECKQNLNSCALATPEASQALQKLCPLSTILFGSVLFLGFWKESKN